MISLLVFFSLLGIAICSTHLLNRSFELVLPSLFAFISIFLYAFSLFGYLEIASLFLILTGSICFFREVINKGLKKDSGPSYSSGFKFFLIASLGFWCLTRFDYYSNFNFVDDFSHWARITKLIVANHSLPLPGEGVWFQDYPPATALFNYHFMSINGFSPNDAMFGQVVVLLSALTIGFYSFNGGKMRMFLVSFAMLGFVFFNGNGPHTLSVDLILGVFFGVSILCYFFETRNCNGSFPFLYIPVIVLLPLIKQMGLVFALIVISIIMIDALIHRPGRIEKQKLLSLLIVSIFLFSAHDSWNAHLDKVGAHRTFQVKFEPLEVKKAFTPSLSSERQKTTIANFNQAVSKPHLSGNAMAYYWLALIVSFLVLIALLDKHGNETNFLIQLSIFVVGFVAYAYLLLYTYLFVFTEYEGIRLASFSRYLGSYLVAILFVLFVYSSWCFSQQARSKPYVYFLICILTLMTFPSVGNEIKGLGRIIKNKKFDQVYLTSKYANFVYKRVETGAKVYFVMQGNDGTENVIFNYAMLPRKSTQDCTSLGLEGLYEGDVWTCHLTVSDFSKRLKEYDYLYLAYAELSFIKTYSELFTDPLVNGGLYKVKSSNGKVQLNLLEKNPDRVHVPEHLAKLGSN